MCKCISGSGDRAGPLDSDTATTAGLGMPTVAGYVHYSFPPNDSFLIGFTKVMIRDPPRNQSRDPSS
jgi:hypothetical protein